MGTPAADALSLSYYPGRAVTGYALPRSLSDVLAFRAPYLEKKLIRLGIAADAEEGAGLLQEVKKYLVLSELHPNRRIPMFSTLVDEVWHQFVLFTAVYSEFCREFLGRFVHHVPSELPEPERATVLPVMSMAEFRQVYEATFGDFAAAWHDELSVTPASRLCWSTWAMPLAVRTEGEKTVLFRHGEQDTVLCRVDVRAARALAFIAEHRFFVVRELPGLANPDDGVALCRPLVQFNILRLAL